MCQNGRRRFRNAVLGLSVAAAGVLGISGSVRACDPPQPVYKTIVRYVEEQVQYQVKVLRYLPCGTPYYTVETRVKTVLVPTAYRVRVHL